MKMKLSKDHCDESFKNDVLYEIDKYFKVESHNPVDSVSIQCLDTQI